MLRQTLRRLRDKVFGRNTRTTIIVINAPVAPPPTRTPSHVIRSNAQRSAPPADLSLKLHELDEAQRGRRDQSALPTVVTHRETYVVDRNKPETIFELPPYTEADNSNGGEHSEANNAGKESTNKPPAYEDKAHHNINHIRFVRKRNLPADSNMSPEEFEQMLENRLDMEIWIRGNGSQKVQKRTRARGWLSKVVCCGA